MQVVGIDIKDLERACEASKQDGKHRVLWIEDGRFRTEIATSETLRTAMFAAGTDGPVWTVKAPEGVWQVLRWKQCCRLLAYFREIEKETSTHETE